MNAGVCQRWRVGDVIIAQVVEHTASWSRVATFPQMTAIPDWVSPGAFDLRGDPILSIHSFVIDSPGLRVVVDTCAGNDKQRSVPEWNLRTSPFLHWLERAGYPAHTIDAVINTHLHPDHVGWNTRRVGTSWAPAFSNARYLIVDEEWRAVPSQLSLMCEDSVTPLFAESRVDLVSNTHRLSKEIVLEPSPGHTAGHVCVRISSQGQEAVITGDVVHHPGQLAAPSGRCAFDSDPELGGAARTRFLHRYANSGVLVLATHFPDPTAGYIYRDKAGFRFEAAPALPPG